MAGKADLRWLGNSHTGLRSAAQTPVLLPRGLLKRWFPLSEMLSAFPQHLGMAGSCSPFRFLFEGHLLRTSSLNNFLKVASFPSSTRKYVTLLCGLHSTYHYLRFSPPFIYLHFFVSLLPHEISALEKRNLVCFFFFHYCISCPKISA